MEICDKLLSALSRAMPVEYARLDDDDGVSGFVVSPAFDGLSTWDRQKLIEEALAKANPPLARAEQRHVLIIAGLTPAEYDEVGARIMVRKIRELAAGTVEVQVQGGPSDAEYVRGALTNEKGVKADEPKQLRGAAGMLMCFRARGTDTAPLTKAKALRLLKRDRYVAIMPGA